MKLILILFLLAWLMALSFLAALTILRLNAQYIGHWILQ